jgi:hypothetical protein
VVLAPCVTCDKEDCGATLILSASSETKHYDSTDDCFDLVCPACKRPFSVSIFRLQWLEVDTNERSRGFFGPGPASKIMHWMHSHLAS